MRHTMHLQPGVAKQPYLELKTWRKQLLGSLPLVITLPGPGKLTARISADFRKSAEIREKTSCQA
jgi:hypothetical protein